MAPRGVKKAKANQYTANQLFTGFMVVTMSFLVFAMFPEWSETRGLDSMLTRMGVRRSRVEVGCTGYGEARTCSLQAKKAVQPGEKMFQIPQESVMQAQTIADEAVFKEVLASNNEALRDAMSSADLMPEFFYSPFVVFFKIWHERKLGSSSELYQWFEMMPKQPNHGLFFTETEAKCLDRLTFGELNSTVTYASNFAKALQSVCAVHSSLYSCQYLDEKTLQEEARWAFAMLQQRTWGEFRQPMLIPLVDFAYPHPDLCSPDGDKDVKCKKRDNQYFLIPQQQEGDPFLAFKSNFAAQKGDKIYATSHNRAPWETLVTYGYADYAAAVVPDLVFTNRFQRFAQEQKLDVNTLSPEHPLKKCSNRNQMVWRESGIAAPELRACWASLYYFIEHPDQLQFDDDARDAYKVYFEDSINKLKSKYLASRALLTAAEQLGAYVVQPPEHQGLCSGEEGRLPMIKQSYDITGAFFQRVITRAQAKAVETFGKWAAQDSTAARDVPEPEARAPKAEVVEEEAVDTDSDIQE
eukprot:TRINITY_DN73389_c0_g1_i1.p2 TRINITY_DN73389_c0_g1~~TRINITY_DN73389_c0_g1_i1.p2  ORF type:complete len:525 (+),score=236.88 TRINITY_DN73389_c0_g1_i1:91-1665(+)